MANGRLACALDYNQNAWGRTLAVHLLATPVPRRRSDAGHVERDQRGIRPEDFTIIERPARVTKLATCGSRCSRNRPLQSVGYLQV